MPDQKLIVRQVIDGDKESYRLLVDRYSEGLVRYCYSITKDPASAHDAAQQAFISAYENLGQYKPQYAFSTWLYRIARNIALKEFKKQQKHTELKDKESDNDEPLHETLDRDSEAVKVHDALENLRHEWREIIHFYYWEGKTYEEVADVMNKPTNTIKVWMRRAKQQLSKELVKEEL